MYKAGDIAIRRVRYSDAAKLLEWENNREFWRVSDRNQGFTLQEIEQFIEDQQESAFDLTQIRYMIIEQKTQLAIGAIDLYEINWESNSACIGILIANKEHRKRAAGKVAIALLEQISVEELELDTLYARIQPDNEASLLTFQRSGFLKKNEISDGEVAEAGYIHYFTFEKWLRK